VKSETNLGSDNDGFMSSENHGVVWFPSSEKMGLRFRSRETFRKNVLSLITQQFSTSEIWYANALCVPGGCGVHHFR